MLLNLSFCCCCLVTKMCPTLCDLILYISLDSLLYFVALAASYKRITHILNFCLDLAARYLVTQSCQCVQLFATSWTSPPGSSVHGDSSGKNTGVGCHALLQEIFPTQGLNPGLPHCGWILSHLSHLGGPRILEWVAYPFSRGSSQPRNRVLHCRWILYQLISVGLMNK